ncbi:MAG TPA: DUF2752 domain-containing protein [Leptolyngbyaceae cyanobacterium M33_DOE_097]|uniref:DUF2752 domain-containing protein n=1 Tax=Oscillatoriales cyanobacterium SpSt-418 TaxID=2282169 RepID=A0A7C3PGB3_9CYAN|nr:DUF2752 domain-containing protein [Leptolyngbyaceae cyanobacterium M33_DOE_097]
MFRIHRDRLSTKALRYRWSLLGGGLFPLLGAYSHSQGISLPFLACPIKLLTGIPCPTCGMTRSFLAMAQGQWQQAATYHLFGPILFVSFIGVVVHMLVELFTQKSVSGIHTRLLSDRQFQIIMFVSFLLYYGLRLSVRYAWLSEALPWFNHGIGQILIAAAKDL